MARLALVTGSTSGIGLGIARVSLYAHVRWLIFACACAFGCRDDTVNVHDYARQVLAGKGHDVILHGLGTSEVIQSAIQTCRDAAAGFTSFVLHNPQRNPTSILRLVKENVSSPWRRPL